MRCDEPHTAFPPNLAPCAYRKSYEDARADDVRPVVVHGVSVVSPRFKSRFRAQTQGGRAPARACARGSAAGATHLQRSIVEVESTSSAQDMTPCVSNDPRTLRTLSGLPFLVHPISSGGSRLRTLAQGLRKLALLHLAPEAVTGCMQDGMNARAFRSSHR